MKRSPMPRRRAPMARTSIKRSAPMPAHDRHLTGKAKPKRPATDQVPEAVRTQVRYRSGGRCEASIADVCTGRAEHQHHVVTRGRGGQHTAQNLLDVCGACHRHVHAHPVWATEHGFLARNQRGTE